MCRRIAAVRPHVETALARGQQADIRGVSGACADILFHKEALWTFTVHEDVEPTNNHAERELRGFVLWRKRSFGSQSDHGSRFAERIMTTVHSLRKKQRPVLPLLVDLATGSPAAPGPLLLQAS